MKIRHIMFFAVLPLILIFILSCGKSESGDSGKQPQTIGETAAAPDTAANGKLSFSVIDVEGNSHQFSDFIGKPLIVNFWGTWCPPCRRELPDLKRIYSEFKPQGLEIIGLAVKDQPGQVKSFAEKEGLGWVMLIANRESATAFELGMGVPTTIFLDKDGNEVGRVVGARDYEYFKEQVRKIL